MMRHTHFCHRLGCPGNLGFEVRWARATLTDPEFPVTDTCPHCGSEMHDRRLEWGEPLAVFLEDLGLDVNAVDHWALAAAIQAELERQARAAWSAKRQRATARELLDASPAWLAGGTE